MDAVKLEGGGVARVNAARAVTQAGIAVMGHVGLTPQVSVLYTNTCLVRQFLCLSTDQSWTIFPTDQTFAKCQIHSQDFFAAT